MVKSGFRKNRLTAYTRISQVFREPNEFYLVNFTINFPKYKQCVVYESNESG